MNQRKDLSHHLLYNYLNAKLNMKMTCMDRCFPKQYSTFKEDHLTEDDQHCLSKCKNRIHDFYIITNEVYTERTKK